MWIVFEKEHRSVILTIDANNAVHKELSYKDILKLCETHKIQFKNQTIGNLVGEIRAAFFTTTLERVTFAKARREALYLRDKSKCRICAKELAIKQTHIDHVKPLAAGGYNGDSNLQIICRQCRFEKTHQELLNQEYARVSKTTSSYNTKTLDIITSVMPRTPSTTPSTTFPSSR